MAVVATEIELVPLDLPHLQRLAANEPADPSADIRPGALPPPLVAARALSQLEAGMSAFWCVPFLIVEKASGAVLGGCSFKGEPSNGHVEIGYGVAKSERGRGIATAAVARLLELAVASGHVREVIAHILPDNVASAKVVSRLGFEKGHAFVDSDGERVVEWIYSVAT